jgi:hypothetical protein
VACGAGVAVAARSPGATGLVAGAAAVVTTCPLASAGVGVPPPCPPPETNTAMSTQIAKSPPAPIKSAFRKRRIVYLLVRLSSRSWAHSLFPVWSTDGNTGVPVGEENRDELTRSGARAGCGDPQQASSGKASAAGAMAQEPEARPAAGPPALPVFLRR